MNGTAKRSALFFSFVLAAALFSAHPARAQEAAPKPGASEPASGRDPDASGPDVRELELSLRAGVSVATIQVDGNAATSFTPGAGLSYLDGMLLVGALFDPDPGYSGGGSSGTDSRSGWHLGATVGPAFALTETVRLDLSAEVGLHQLQETLSSSASSYSTRATLPYFGVRPALSVRFGSGKLTGAVGAALYYRLDAGQRQPGGLPDDGGHQLGAEGFLSLRISLLGGN